MSVLFTQLVAQSVLLRTGTILDYFVSLAAPASNGHKQLVEGTDFQQIGFFLTLPLLLVLLELFTPC